MPCQHSRACLSVRCGVAHEFRTCVQAEAAVAAARPAAEEPTVRKGPTPEQITAIKAAIAAASTLEEVRRLEDALRTGHLPSEITIGDDDREGQAAANGAAAAMEQG